MVQKELGSKVSYSQLIMHKKERKIDSRGGTKRWGDWLRNHNIGRETFVFKSKILFFYAKRRSGPKNKKIA